ncbi:uncharacterized protein LOC118826454 isoform X2 [Colossoma macropomum]|uniref:uncharacterized protein LOC118826454 isoform X2 n=1 Tax=Colossoma macropomum TaxID=42526 RepID=UPI00186525F2|nr:uncharacterized protein LOC118826454 isoform X2 [Colossoma macropomum]
MLFFVSVCVLVVHALSSLLHLVVIRWESIKQMQCVYELQRGFSMGALTVLGLQLCLLTFSLGAPYFPVWSVSDTESQDELKSMDQPIMFETGYGELHQAEAPELGLEMKYQDPQDYDITLMSSRTKREAEAAAGKLLHPRPKPHQGKMSPIGNTGEPEVVRAKRQLQKKKKPSKQPSRPGRNSLVGSMGPTVSSIQE